jgi:hypothetical protein
VLAIGQQVVELVAVGAVALQDVEGARLEGVRRVVRHHHHGEGPREALGNPFDGAHQKRIPVT